MRTAGPGWRPAPGTLPDAPGAYRFRDPDGRVIYVGKARSLRSRVSSYFAGPAGQHPRTQALMTTAAGVDWFATTTEVEALQLEYAWIKEFNPRFNVRYRDDKSYPFLAVTMGDELPRVLVTRGRRSPQTRVFGPYPHAWAIRETTDQLLRVFGVRSCSDTVLRRHRLLGRPCLLGDIGRCAAPCVGRVDAAEHRRLAESFCQVLAGGAAPHLRDLQTAMAAAAEAQEYERAARLRDQVGALTRVVERNAVVLPEGTDADLIAVAGDELEAALRVLHVRGGRIRGERSHIVDRGATQTDGDLIRAFLVEAYAESHESLPAEVLVSADPGDPALIQWLAGLRGSSVDLRVPRRGDKRALLAMTAENAAAALAAHRLRRAGDLTVRGQALAEVQTALGMAEAPLRIEAVDISQHAGADVVASLVVFEDGAPQRSAYRNYTITGAVDDCGAIREVVRRRFTGSAATRYPPSLLVVDGGPAQADAAAAEIAALELPHRPTVIGLAKRLEEVWPAGAGDPIILPRTGEGLYLLQRIRDEAHRVAHRHHGRRRSAGLRRSALDSVAGLGPSRRAALLRRFGSVAAIRRADPAALAAVPGIGPGLAARISEALTGTDSRGHSLPSASAGVPTKGARDAAVSAEPLTEERAQHGS